MEGVGYCVEIEVIAERFVLTESFHGLKYTDFHCDTLKRVV